MTTLLALTLLAQVQVQIQAPLPVIRFEAPPPLVVVEPGIQVVPEHDEEIFFHDGWYWHRTGGRWYRSRDHQGHWAVVEERVVPAPLARIPVGKYRHWKHEVREERREERREDKREAREDKREQREERREEKEERREEKHHGKH